MVNEALALVCGRTTYWVDGSLLLLIGNKTFGISSSMRHICAACMPANIPFFKYDWKKEWWNLFFVVGIILVVF
jgi:hypothetical protein